MSPTLYRIVGFIIAILSLAAVIGAIKLYDYMPGGFTSGKGGGLLLAICLGVFALIMAFLSARMFRTANTKAGRLKR